MTPTARLSAAIEVLTDLFARRRPAQDALKDWGLSHRFAGSSDRAAIASLVYDTLRCKASSAWLMKDETPRALVLGMLRLQRHVPLEAIDALCGQEVRFAPSPLTDIEREHLSKADLSRASMSVQGDYPDWLTPSLKRTFGDECIKEMQALAQRAPLDVRINTFKATRDEVLDALAHHKPTLTPYSRLGLRFNIGEDGRGPSLQSEGSFQLGAYEIQDEGSQLTVALADVKEGQRVIDLCAGAGGKTLALAAALNNTGEVIATDVDTRRLSPIHQRLQRAGVTNVIVRAPHNRGHDALIDMAQSADCVFIDAPCTGTGTWRRNPDAKWRLRPNALADRRKDQATVLERGAALLKKGGSLVYVTCSILPEENDEAIKAFLKINPHFKSVSLQERANTLGLPFEQIKTPLGGLQLTPARTKTDGFYIACLRKTS
jgi:16S rRNA (cytosine967-C5)-methyltransferase